MARRNIVNVEVGEGLSSWSYRDLTLEAGAHDVDVAGNKQLAQAIRDAADAGVGVTIIDEKE